MEGDGSLGGSTLGYFIIVSWPTYFLGSLFIGLLWVDHLLIDSLGLLIPQVTRLKLEVTWVEHSSLLSNNLVS
jgi:hypothetical protein